MSEIDQLEDDNGTEHRQDVGWADKTNNADDIGDNINNCDRSSTSKQKTSRLDLINKRHLTIKALRARNRHCKVSSKTTVGLCLPTLHTRAVIAATRQHSITGIEADLLATVGAETYNLKLPPHQAAAIWLFNNRIKTIRQSNRQALT